MRYYLVAVLLTLVSGLGFAQSTVSGIVIEEGVDGKFKPIPFANVFWLGTQSGTATDTNGYFELPVSKKTYMLVISYVGYNGDTITVEQPDKLTIVLKKEQVLDAVEVVYREKSTEISYMNPIKTEQIGQDELYKAACCNLSESFETNPSVDVTYTDAVTGTKQIQMLGLDGKYTQITREAIPDVRGLASFNGLTYIPGTWISGIQLNKGAGSVASGFESVTGQINVELDKPQTMKRWFINGYGNQGGRSELNLQASQRLGEKVSTALLLHGDARPFEVNGNGDSFLDFPTGHMLNGVNRWYFTNNKGWNGQMGVRVIDEEKRGGQTEQVVGTPYLLGWNTRRYEGWGKTGYVFPEKKYQSIGVQTKAVLHQYDGFFGNRPYTAEQQSAYVNTLYQSIISTTTHKFRTGAGLQYDRFEETLDNVRYEREEIVPGAFFEYTFTYFEKFALVAGLRGDYHNYYGFFATPRLHMRYEVAEGSVLRASVGRGQRTSNVIAENMSLLATSRDWMIEGDPSIPGFGLAPEVAWNFGLNFVQNLRIDYRPATLSIDLYHTEFENQTVVDMEDPRSVYIYNLTGRSYSTSAQAQFDYELMRRLNVRLAYRWYDVMTTYGGTLLTRPYISRHRAFVNLAYETKNDWSFDYTVQWQGPKRIPSIESNLEDYRLDSYSPDLIIMNAQISKTWKDRYAVYVGMENITNVRQPNPIVAEDDPYGPYFDSSLIWGPIFGRMTYVGFRLSSKN